MLESCEHDESSAAEAYARLEHLRISSESLDTNFRNGANSGSAKSGLASGVSSERKYEYDAMSQLLKVLDAEENETSVQYDLLGRKVELQNKDSGKKTYAYDDLKLLYESNSVLDKSGSRIDYEYDGFGRVTKIVYPVGGTVEYVYGTPRDNIPNANGKILSVKDASGTNFFEYGALGETTKETRTLNRHDEHSEKTMTATMEYKSDYLGRMQHIVYPDGEKIYYEYDEGGQVTSVKGEHNKDGTRYIYVSDIGYDEYSQRTYIKYGNGVETHYEYDREMRWLESIATKNLRGVQLQNMQYDFDDVGNIKQYTNDCLTSTNAQGVSGRYKTEQKYTYDGLYQLTSVKGDAVNDDYASSSLGSAAYNGGYTQTFAFDAIGNMTRKVSVESVTSGRRIGDGLIYSFDYVYDENFAHRLKRAGNEQNGYRHFSYDENGNVIEEKDTISANPNEETSGLLPATMSVTSNAAGETVYRSDYAWGYFKDASTGSSYGGSYKRTYEWDSRNLLIASSDNTNQVYYIYDANGERTNKYTHRSETLYFNTFWNWHKDSAISLGQYSKNIYLGTTRLVTKLHKSPNEWSSSQATTANCYYYHSDHLGSAQLITDYKGNEYQRLEYTPYGELWIEKTSSEASAKYLPYKFTGKERDEETGLYYFGARYLDPKYSRWLSTDPALQDYIPTAGEDNVKLPNGGVHNHVNLSLYHYSNNNPVKYADPDGKFPIHIVIGAVIGGVSSAAISMGSQLATKGEINVKETLISAGAGVLSGALAASGVGFVGQVALNATISAVQEVGTELSNGESVDAKKVGVSAMVGAVGGALGGRGAETSNIKAASKQFEKRVVNAFQHKTGDALRKEVTKATSNYMKNAGLKQVVGETGKAIGRSTVPGVIKNIYDYKNEKGKHNENNQ